MEVAIFGAYGWIATERLYGRQFVSALMLRGDMVDIGDRGTPAERQQVNDFNMDADNAMVRVFWPYWYQTISAANAAIAGAESLSTFKFVLTSSSKQCAVGNKQFAYCLLLTAYCTLPTEPVNSFLNVLRLACR